MPSEAPTWEESTATPTWENSTETPTWEDSSDTPQKQGYAAAVGNSLAQEAVKGVGHALAGYGSLTEIMPVSAGVGAAPSAYDIQENIRRSRRTAAQVMTAIQQNPAVRMGQAIAAAAPETYPVDAARQQEFIPKAAGMVGSFLPLVASGPLAPATIGLQSLGAHLDEDWKQAKADGLTDEAAARRAMDRGLASGALQATLFLALPKPLRMAGEKYLVEKFGTSAVKEFLAGRVALGGEGAVLGGASTMAENVVGGRPLTQDVGAGAAGLGAFNLVLPPYFRGGRNRPADAIEGELLGKVPPRSAAQVERLPAAVTDAGLNEVVPTDLTTDIRRAPMPLAGDPPLRSESSSTPEAVKPTENVPAAATPPVAAPEQSVETKPATENVAPATENVVPVVVKPASSENPGLLDKAQAAVEGRIDEIKREGRLRAFGDPELAGLRVAQGAIYVIKGVKNFAEWSAQMVKRFGNEIKPHLEDLWEQAKQVAAGTHPTIGLSQHGVKTIANEELSASVREALNVHYAKLTDESARTIAGARIAEAGGPLPAAAKLNAGAFDGEPGKVQNAIAAATMRRLSLQERLARERGAEQQADALADAQVAVAQRSIDRSPDAGQTLQSFKLFYEQFSPAAWVRKFKKDIGQVAVTRTEAAIGKPVEPSPAGVAQGIADKVGEETAKRNPKLGRIIQEEFGTAGTAEGTARPVGETLADRLERTGRAAKGNGKAVADKISKFYQEEVGKFRRLHGIPAFDPATQRDILRRAKAIDALPEDSVQRREAAQELMNHIRRLKGFQWWELPLDFWYANILSGPVTHLKNISGNAASLGAEVGMQIMRQPSALPSIIEALGRALPRGATEAANILRTGHDTASRHAGKFETHGALDAVTGTAGKLLLPWKLVGRGLKAADVMFFYPLQETKGAVLASRASGLPIFNGERAAEVRRIMGWSEQARAKAAAQAKAEGLTGNTARRREYELLEQARPETLMESARDFAFHGTFNNDPYGVLGAVQRGFERTAREVPALKLIAPFTRIITNITNSGMNWTPVGYWRAARAQGLKLLIGRETNTGKLYGRTISDPTAVGDAYARATVGSLALGGLAMAAGQYVFDRNPQFMVTGSGPADPDQRKLLRQTGWIPYSIKIGDRYYTYQDKTWAMPLGVVGHYLDAIRYRKLDQQDALNRAAFALSSSFNVIVQSSWLQGLSAIFDQAGRDSVKNPLKALPSQALRTASSFVVPNALRQVDQMFDPTRYTADDIQAMMLAQLPLARRENRPDLNVFGEPVAAPLSKTFLSKVEGDGLTRMLAARRLWPGVPADPYLTPAQTYALVKYRGPQLRAELLANYADLATLPHAEANALLARLSRDATVQAKKDLGLDTLSGIEKQVSKFNER